MPFGGMVRVVFGEMRDFTVACQGDISLGGMYLPTAEFLPVGTSLDLELMLGDELTLIRGRGEVVWLGQGPPSKSSRPGMGIRFLTLDPIGRDLIFRTVDRYIQTGGLPFDLDGIEYRSAAGSKSRWRSPLQGPRSTKDMIAGWCSDLVGRYGSRPASGVDSDRCQRAPTSL
ncbi:MAG: PilZ domain-containing protein [Thermoanaerobaculia bacterium]|nr:PilZ domain-containing protein [Thermoanaerobaculia bacterium]